MTVTNNVPALKPGVKFIFFTDFDGTITLKDSNDWLTDNLGYGEARRLQENQDTLNGRNAFRDSFKGMMDSVTTPFNQCVELLVQNITLDPHFRTFFHWARDNNVPVVVLSSGMVPVIRALLRHNVGPESDEIEVVSNDVKTRPGKTLDDEDGWDLAFRDESGYGHDKSVTLRPYAQLPPEQRPTMFYAGDGVSDLSAARETDLLFAKRGKDLVTFCARENVPFTTFDDFESIHETVKGIVAGKRTVQDVVNEGLKHYQEHATANGKA